ncbi:hypothetical protein B0F89_10316 [Malaciobacter marinus]|jgi:hypothetical protein|uniref:YtxH-like protein n=1 Tax=Malaciobacter marinus TaxID=505249 RepID=A0AB36ZYI7_9BACT|nr:hypothetical protein [Malaciobacter marinus]PPK62424.1 hypothetical protein B0F89_10316 [Malaciobacter marinus]
MALPFIAGLAIGAGAVFAYKNSDKLKSKTKELLGKSKEFTDSTIEQGKEAADEVKSTIEATKECIKEKKEAKKLEEAQVEKIEKKENE